MADASAFALAEDLLSDGGGQPDKSLVESVSADPPLALWAVCAADRHGRFVPRSVAELCVWLRAHALEVLQWPRVEPPVPKSNDAWLPDALGPEVVAGVELAETAASLALGKGQTIADSAFLLGLLGRAGQWLAMTRASATGHAEVPDCLPAWLAHPGDGPASSCVEQARDVLSGNTPLPEGILQSDVEACRQRAADAGRRWLASVPGIGPWLPRLTARLARLESLEKRFQETLEAEKLEAMAEFAAGAGHEINNPLAVIAGRAQLFLQEETDAERRRALALMNAQAKRVYEMIADMMLFARPPMPELELVDLVGLVDRVVEDMAPLAARQDTAVRRGGVTEPLEVEVDPTQWRVALLAICQNALEAVGHGGHVALAVEAAGDRALVRISDDGPGIAPEQCRHLFDPFYSARQAGRGLGLGLSKAWRIVTNHGGEIRVDSELDRGTTFTVAVRSASCSRNNS